MDNEDGKAAIMIYLKLAESDQEDYFKACLLLMNGGVYDLLISKGQPESDTDLLYEYCYWHEQIFEEIFVVDK